MSASPDEISERLARLEEHRATGMVQLGIVTEQLHAVNVRLDTIERTMLEVRDRVLTWRDCPEPGLCVTLRNRIEEHADDLTKLKTDRAVVVEGWKLVGIVASVVIAVGTAAFAIWKFVEMLVHRKP